MCGKEHHSRSTQINFGGHLMVLQVGIIYLKIFRKKYFRAIRVGGGGVNCFITSGFMLGWCECIVNGL